MRIQFRSIINGPHGIAYTLDDPTCRTIDDCFALKWWKIKGTNKYVRASNVAEFWIG